MCKKLKNLSIHLTHFHYRKQNLVKKIDLVKRRGPRGLCQLEELTCSKREKRFGQLEHGSHQKNEFKFQDVPGLLFTFSRTYYKPYIYMVYNKYFFCTLQQCLESFSRLIQFDKIKPSPEQFVRRQN